MLTASHLSTGEPPHSLPRCVLTVSFHVFVSRPSTQMSSPLCLGSRGRCQSHAYLSPHLRAKAVPGSWPHPPAAPACRVTAAPPTTGRCQSLWWRCLPRASNRSSSTLGTASRACPPWCPPVRPHSTPWPLNRSLVTSASTLVSSSALTAVFVQWGDWVRNVPVHVWSRHQHMTVSFNMQQQPGHAGAVCPVTVRCAGQDEPQSN